MSVNIKLTTNAIVAGATTVSGSISVTGAKKDNTESLNVSVYDSVANVKLTSSAITYTGSGTSVYSYSDGTTMTINHSSGTWSYQIPATVIITKASYVFTFTWVDGTGTNMFSVLSKQNSVSQTYNYTPGYEVVCTPGSTETTSTAWSKYIEEIKRIYRYLNENLSYYDSKYASLANGFNYFVDTTSQALSGFLDSVNTTIKNIKDYVDQEITKVNTAMTTLKGDVDKELKGKLNAKCQVVYVPKARFDRTGTETSWTMLSDFSSIGFTKVYFAMAISAKVSSHYWKTESAGGSSSTSDAYRQVSVIGTMPAGISDSTNYGMQDIFAFYVLSTHYGGAAMKLDTTGLYINTGTSYYDGNMACTGAYLIVFGE